MKSTRRRTIVKDILWVIAAIGLVAMIARFIRGLGATTALNDATPWGLWISFDVMAGVALAAGGFTIAAAVYIFHLEKYHSILRPAILTAFLGYVAVIVGLLCDLGLPWHIWSPMIHWQPHSVLFEVAWCVMLYTSVLALEFSPVILESPWLQTPFFQRLARWLKWFTLPLVILGIVLSTLHQSSLGSLFLIMPFRLHPLWYSPILPVLFFISAVALGLMMVTLEGFVSAYLFDHSPRLDLLAGLGRAAVWVLWLYLLARLGDLAWRGVLPAAVEGSWYSFLFWAEIGLGGLLPASLLSLRQVRTSPAGLITAAGLTVAGLVFNRLSVGGLAIFQTSGTSYFPGWVEFAISAGIVAGAGLVFLFLAENFNVFNQTGAHVASRPSPFDRPVFDAETRLYQGQNWWDKVSRRTFFLVPVVAVGIALLPAGGVGGQTGLHTPARAALGWTVMRINGNRNGLGVTFDHVGHQQRLGWAAASAGSTCIDCHHLNKPADEATACWECHQDMNQPASIFNHSLHQVELGGNASCGECHQAEHTAGAAKACAECHETMMPQAGEARFNNLAPGYKDAMHGACLPCHQQEAETQGKPELGRCPACHKFEDDATSPQTHIAQRD